MHSDHVEHKGVVKQVSFNSIVISVEEPHQCEGCSIAVVCGGKTDKDNDTIVVPRPRGEEFAPGDRVTLEASSGSQLRATFWAFVLPTIILVGTVLVLMNCLPELGALLSAVIAAAAVAVYELILYLFRKDLAMAVTWQIRHC